MIENLNDYPFIYEVPVAWGEMDAFGHVNNVVFFRYFESARIAYLNHLEYHELAKKTGVSVILSYIDCKYIRPLFYPDSLKIGARITKIEKDRFNMDYALFSSKTNKISALANSTIVTYDYTNNCKADIPEEFRQKILNIL